jgi:hypothetical protein
LGRGTFADFLRLFERLLIETISTQKAISAGMEEIMRKIYVVATLVALAGFAVTASAQNRTLTGAAIGVGAGAVVAGPPGAVVGGVIGATVGGPDLRTRRQTCWRDRRGLRHCRWR